jgi:hypothetical protein
LLYRYAKHKEWSTKMLCRERVKNLSKLCYIICVWPLNVYFLYYCRDVTSFMNVFLRPAFNEHKHSNMYSS